LILYARLGVYKPPLVCDSTITSHKDIVGDRLSEDFDLQDVSNDFLCFAIDVWMYEGDVVVACDDVSERRQSLLYPLNGDGIWKGVSKMLKFLVSCC